MNKTRLTTDKPPIDMNMVELALNCVYIDEEKRVRYRDYEQDWDARELAELLLRNMSELPEYLGNGSVFDMFMAELLSDPIDSTDGLIAVFYRNLWAMAELRARLKEYEDTGLAPEDIEKLKER